MTTDPMPVFTIQAKDKLAVGALVDYKKLCLAADLHDQAAEVDEAIREMVAWADRNPRAMKWPDHDHVPATAQPETVVLCGSTRFYDAFQQANYDLTMAGHIVLSVGFYPHAKAQHGHGEGVGHDSAEKVALDELHLRKIDRADWVYVLDCEVDGQPYIGESTAREIAYAEQLGKPVRYLSAEIAERDAAFDGSTVDATGNPHHDALYDGMRAPEACDIDGSHDEVRPPVATSPPPGADVMRYPSKRPGWLGRDQPYPCGRCGQEEDDAEPHECVPPPQGRPQGAVSPGDPDWVDGFGPVPGSGLGDL